MQWTCRFVAVVIFLGLGGNAMAAQSIPTLTGDWLYRGTPACAPCTLRIDKQEPDGKLEARIYWANSWTRGTGTAVRNPRNNEVKVKITFEAGNYVDLSLKKNDTSLLGRLRSYAEHGTGWIVEFRRPKPGKK